MSAVKYLFNCITYVVMSESEAMSCAVCVDIAAVTAGQYN